MRRYALAVNGRTLSLDVRELGADRFEVRLEGRTLEVVLKDESELPGAVISPEMATALAAPAAAAAERPAPTQTGAAVAPAPLPRPGLTNTAAVAAARTLAAPMPGTVAAVEVTAGSAVRRGDVLLTLEAMKMLNPIRAPRDAVVSAVDVAQGQTVAFGDPLLRFEG